MHAGIFMCTHTHLQPSPTRIDKVLATVVVSASAALRASLDPTSSWRARSSSSCAGGDHVTEASTACMYMYRGSQIHQRPLPPLPPLCVADLADPAQLEGPM